MPRPRILLSAFACDPKTGSEPYVGWNWAAMLAADYEVHVLTRQYSRPLIAGHPLEAAATFHYFDLPFCNRFNHHWRLIKLYYCLWQICVLPFALFLNLRYGFQIVQHLTYNNIDVPGFLWLCPGARFVWGPVGGGQAAPATLRAVYGRQWWKERLRGLLKASARYNPVIQAALRRARLVFFANEETAARVAGISSRSQLLLETAIDDPGNGPAGRRPCGGNRVRILWLSHVFLRKALGLAIDAFAAACRQCPPGCELELVVVGDGPALAAARAQALDTGLGERIRLLGAVTHDEVQSHMREADIFLFTSVQDTSGNVMLEAMVNGLPVIALNHQGARAILLRQGGCLVPIGTYGETVARIGAAILDLALSEARRRELGAAARRQVLEHHTWAAKRHTVHAAYSEVLAEP